VKGSFHRAFSAWFEAARMAGFFILLVAGSAGLGCVIAWPLWAFATSERTAYTIFALCLAGGGLAAFAARSIIRGRRVVRDPGKPRRTVLSLLLTVVLVGVVLAGAYVEAVMLSRGLWILAIPAFVLWAGLVWLAAFTRRRAKEHKERPVPAENKGE
jgi:hypothetical protein